MFEFAVNERTSDTEVMDALLGVMVGVPIAAPATPVVPAPPAVALFAVA